MNRHLATAATAVFCICAPLKADFTYEQNTKITGGAMAAMMKMAGAFSKAAREPMHSVIYVKGDRMAQYTGNRNAHIIDLANETMTEVDLERKTYSTITFADMREAMNRAAQKMAENKKDGTQDAEMNFKASVKNTGASKVVDGLNAKQAILLLVMEAKDRKSGQSGNFAVTNDMWLTPKMPGYDEVINFHKRMAEKLAWSGMGSGFQALAGRPDMAKGFAEMAKEMSKLNGVPVLQITRMGAASDMAEAEKMATMPVSQSGGDTPSGGQMAGAAAGSAAESTATSKLGRLGGLAGGLGGGLGGFGRKKKTEEEPAAQPKQAESAQGSAMLMEMTTELTTFTSGPVDSAKLDVPAGFKQVEHPMQRELRKK